jgi:predicted transcriptional regulator
LREAGTYGYLVKIPIDEATLEQSKASGRLLVRFEVDEASSGGLAIYGRDFGRYPLDPTIIFK